MVLMQLLSNREKEVVNQLLQGKSNKLIAAALGISDRTVEFHLKNVYTKFKVSSRIELILLLGNTPGKLGIEKLGYSPVDTREKSTENRDKQNSWMDWMPSFKEIVSIIGKEYPMKNIFSTKHVLVGVITALFTGLVWMMIWKNIGRVSQPDMMIWIGPLIVVWTLIGLSVGLMGKRNYNTLLKVCLGTLFGTGLSPIAILPVMGIVVYPIGKLAEWAGLIHMSTMSSNIATILATLMMIALWLVLGIMGGVMLLSVTLKKAEQIVV
jgi:DNA-binding CsgD family transcriptional regulator